MNDSSDHQLIAPAEKKKLLLVGCGRSGTLYSAEVFRSLGLDILHERHSAAGSRLTGKDGYASWFLTVDDPAPPYGPNRTGQEFEFVLHQVRHPLEVIASFAQYILQQGIKSSGFLEKYVPGFRDDLDIPEMTSREKLILQASRYWYHWNLLSEQVADETIPLEHLTEELPRLCDALSIDYVPEHVARVSRKTNQRGLWVREAPWQIDWQEIADLDPVLYGKIRELAAGYGYDE